MSKKSSTILELFKVPRQLSEMIAPRNQEKTLTKIRVDLKTIDAGLEETKRELEVLERGLRETDAKADEYLSLVQNQVYISANEEENHKPACLEGTRKSVLGEIDCWIAASNELEPIFWLTGSHGTGKTTIAQTIKNARRDSKLPVSSHFCSRDGSRNLHSIFPNLAHRFARFYPKFRTKLFESVGDVQNPLYLSWPLDQKVRELIIKPLREESGVKQVVFVIDALGECEGDAIQLLEALCEHIEEIRGVGLKLLITGFPFEDTSNSQMLLKWTEQGFIKTFDLNNAPKVEEDIKRFFEVKLLYFKSQLPGYNGFRAGEWLTQRDLDLLCSHAAGLFSNAVGIFDFLSDEQLTLEETVREWDLRNGVALGSRTLTMVATKVSCVDRNTITTVKKSLRKKVQNAHGHD